MSRNKDAILEALRKVKCAEAGGPDGVLPRCTVSPGLLGPGGIPLLEIKGAGWGRRPDPFPGEVG